MIDINEVEYLKRCEKIREEIIHNEKIISPKNLDVQVQKNREFIHGKIVGLRYCYDLMKQIGIYK
jgi:hypothetical protein